MWKCLRCEKENRDSTEQCVGCGHERTMDYITHRTLSKIPKTLSEKWKLRQNSQEYLVERGNEHLQKAIEFFEQAQKKEVDKTTQKLYIELKRCLFSSASEKVKSEKPILMADEDKTTVLGSKLLRKNIQKIEFVKVKKEKIPSGVWDISEDKKKTIQAWTESTDKGMILKIGSENGVYANPSCKSFFAGYLNVKKIEFNNLFDTSRVVDMQNMFGECLNLKSVDVNGFNTCCVTNMMNMFYKCAQLQKVDVSGFNISHVTDMQRAFSKCRSLKKIDVSKFDTAQIINMKEMFCGCRNLEEIDTSRFDTGKVTNMAGMFCGCRMLKEVDTSGFDTSNVIDARRMFASCRNLVKPNFSDFHFNMQTETSGMFEGSGLFDSNQNKISEKAVKKLEIINYDQLKKRKYNRTYKGNSIEKICLNFLSYEENKSVDTGRKDNIINTLKIPSDDTIYLIHDDSWFKRGKNGFAVTDRGLYVKDDTDMAVFVSWEEFRECENIKIGSCCIVADGKKLAYLSSGNEIGMQLECMLIAIHELLNE